MTEEEALDKGFVVNNETETLVKPSEILSKKNEADTTPFEEEHVVKPSERLKVESQRETTSSDEERLVRPSERLAKLQQKSETKPEPLTRPSEVVKTVMSRKEPSDGEKLVKPSEKFKEQTSIQSESVLKPSEVIASKNKELSHSSRMQRSSVLQVPKPKEHDLGQQEKHNDDPDEYKRRVRETLEEVVGLLERLME